MRWFPAGWGLVTFGGPKVEKAIKQLGSGGPCPPKRFRLGRATAEIDPRHRVETRRVQRRWGLPEKCLPGMLGYIGGCGVRTQRWGRQTVTLQFNADDFGFGKINCFVQGVCVSTHAHKHGSLHVCTRPVMGMDQLQPSGLSI